MGKFNFPISDPLVVTLHRDLTDQVTPLQPSTSWYWPSTMTKPCLWYDYLRWSPNMLMLALMRSSLFWRRSLAVTMDATNFILQILIQPNLIAKRAAPAKKAAPKKAGKAAKKAAPKRAKKTAAKKTAPKKKAAAKKGRGKKWSVSWSVHHCVTIIVLT